MNTDAITARVSTWRQLLRGQFGLRALLVLMLVAAALAWWLAQPPKGVISEWTANQIKSGMTRSEVERMAGPPLYRLAILAMDETTWIYKVATQDLEKQA